MVVFQDQVDQGIEAEGSNLSGVTSRCIWEDVPQSEIIGHSDDDHHDNRYNDGDRRGSHEVGKSHISAQGNQQ